ncbi:MAG: hypothetical protein Q8L29_02560 [archaeon]|nr:hypothetical protein [archaeon]
MAENKNLECCGKPLEFKLQRGHYWQEYIPETAECLGCKSYLERKPGRDNAYQNKGDGYHCTKCGSETEVVVVSHPVWARPDECTGSGNVVPERVPYCPKCEERPSTEGKIIQMQCAINN